MLSGAPATSPISSHDAVMHSVQASQQACWQVKQHLGCHELSKEHQTNNTAMASRFTKQAQLAWQLLPASKQQFNLFWHEATMAMSGPSTVLLKKSRKAAMNTLAKTHLPAHVCGLRLLVPA